MEKEKIILTEEGLQKFKEELFNLKNVERIKNTEDIKEAKAQGDLSENADYDAARNRQAEIEGRIQYLENLIEKGYSSYLHYVESNGDEVRVGCTVELKAEDEEEIETYTIVGSAEADPINGKISNECLLAQAILGHKVNDEVVVKCEEPYSVKIINVSK